MSKKSTVATFFSSIYSIMMVIYSLCVQRVCHSAECHLQQWKKIQKKILSLVQQMEFWFFFALDTKPKLSHIYVILCVERLHQERMITCVYLKNFHPIQSIYKWWYVFTQSKVRGYCIMIYIQVSFYLCGCRYDTCCCWWFMGTLWRKIGI